MGNELDKNQQVRQVILARLECGEYTVGQRLPGARTIAQELGISFLKVQQALESLARDGILEVVSRKGTFVQTLWRERVLEDNLSIYRSFKSFPWFSDLMSLVNKEMPGLNATHAFKKSVLEYRTTLTVQQHADEYLDLSGFLDESLVGDSDFFTGPIDHFRVNGRLVGVPFIFSPRVVFFNPTVFEQGACPLPEEGWNWTTFIQTVRCLRRTFPPERIINWHSQAYLWMNFVVRAGGSLFDPSRKDPVAVDSKDTRRGLELFLELRDALELPACCEISEAEKLFNAGQSAMMISDRQYLSQLKQAPEDIWGAVALPLIDGGVDLSNLATDVLCVRKNCTSPALITQYLTVMLSEEIQDFIGRIGYGIPIRKSCAFKSFDLGDRRDALFAVEMGKVRAQYHVGSPVLGNLVVSGIEKIVFEGGDLGTELKLLADMARRYLDIKHYIDDKNAENSINL